MRPGHETTLGIRRGAVRHARFPNFSGLIRNANTGHGARERLKISPLSRSTVSGDRLAGWVLTTKHVASQAVWAC